MKLTRRVDRSVRAIGGWVSRSPVVPKRWFLTARDVYVYLYFTYVEMKNGIQYDAPVEPARVLWVDPDDVRKVSTRGYVSGGPVSKFKKAGSIEGGTWDTLESYPYDAVGRLPKADADAHIDFEQTYVYRAFHHRFVRGGRWDETEYFESVLEEIRDGERVWDCRTEEDLRERCRFLDGLYERIAEEGYRTQVELHSPRTGMSAAVRTFEGEIAVDIARDGELLFGDGRHRLSIVKLLDVDEVPVVVHGRHERWQHLRDDVFTGRRSVESLPAPLGDHPDLTHLVDPGE